VVAQRRAANADDREQAQAEVAALRQQLAALLESKRPLEAETPKGRRRYTLEERLAKLADPAFRVTDTPDWLEGVPNSPWTPLVALLMGLATGTAAGLLNGVLISSLRMVPFIVTLGTMTIFLGLGNWLSGNIPVRPALDQIPHSLATIVSNSPESLLLGFPWGAWLALAMAVLLAAVLKFTVFGRYVFALGSNEATARLCGIHVPGYKTAVYTLGGLLFGIAGIYQFARLSTGNPMSGAGLELKVIAAVVIGGGSLNGGRGTMLGTLAGAAIMAVISSGCTQVGVSNSVQDIILGAVIIGAVALDQLRQRVTAS
jgi:ribose transport system permease protein